MSTLVKTVDNGSGMLFRILEAAHPIIGSPYLIQHWYKPNKLVDGKWIDQNFDEFRTIREAEQGIKRLCR